MADMTVERNKGKLECPPSGTDSNNPNKLIAPPRGDDFNRATIGPAAPEGIFGRIGRKGRGVLSPMIGITAAEKQATKVMLGLDPHIPDGVFLQEYPLQSMRFRGFAGSLWHVATKPTVTVPRVNADDIKSAIPIMPSSAANVLAGAERAAATFTESLASPLGVATLGSGALLRAPKILQAGLAVQLGVHVPEKVDAAAEALVGHDLQGAVEHGLGLALDAAAITHLGRSVASTAKTKPSSTAQVEDIGTAPKKTASAPTPSSQVRSSAVQYADPVAEIRTLGPQAAINKLNGNHSKPDGSPAFVFRGDSRTPEVYFQKGDIRNPGLEDIHRVSGESVGRHTSLKAEVGYEDLPYVSTTTSQSVGGDFAHGSSVYVIDARNIPLRSGVAHEHEWVAANIKPEAIVGRVRVVETERPVERVYGEDGSEFLIFSSDIKPQRGAGTAEVFGNNPEAYHIDARHLTPEGQSRIDMSKITWDISGQRGSIKVREYGEFEPNPNYRNN